MASSISNIPTLNRLDTTNLNKAMAIFRRFGRSAPSLMVNRTAMFVVYETQKNTPFVELGRISSDMQVSVVPVVPTRGVKKGTTQVVMNEKVTMAMKIVLARMHPNSKYNQMTGNRWLIDKPQVGGSNAGARYWSFWNFVEQAAERMVRARRSSTHFLKSSWTPILMKLKIATKSKISIEKFDTNKKVLMTGEVELAQPGTFHPVCKISNTLGMNWPNAILGKKYNDAAHRILEPIMQRAIDKEAVTKLQKAFREGWIDQANLVRQFGLKF
jgi:hypothetical protein